MPEGALAEAVVRDSKAYGILLRCLLGLWLACFVYSLICVVIHLRIRRKAEEPRSLPHMNLFIWSTMLPVSLTRVAYFMILIVLPWQGDVTTACLEVGDCRTSTIADLRSAQFYTILMHDLFYPLFLVIFSGLMLHW
jgi:hypothetical protein